MLESAAANESTKSRGSSSSSWLRCKLLSLSICVVHHPLRVVPDSEPPGEGRVAPAAELTLLDSGWLTKVGLSMMEANK